MPTYVYKCRECQTQLTLTALTYVPGEQVCKDCGENMHRVPQSIFVNWQGNKPSDGGVTPLVQQMIADAPRRRDEMQARKESDGND